MQNKISGVIRRLPDAVQRQGVNVSKSLGDTFMVVGLYDSTGLNLAQKTTSLLILLMVIQQQVWAFRFLRVPMPSRPLN